MKVIYTLNRSTLTGRLVADPQFNTVNDHNVANFTLAVDRNFKDQNGDYQADYIRCSAWRHTADYVKRNIKKGTLVYIDGAIRTNSSKDNNGKNHYYTFINVEDMGKLSVSNHNSNGKPTSDSASSNSNSSSSENTNKSSSASSDQSSQSNSSSSSDDNDLPF